MLQMQYSLGVPWTHKVSVMLWKQPIKKLFIGEVTFKIPNGNVIKKFVLELARLFRAAGEGSALEGIALKAAFTLCSLALQKPSQSSKSKDHISCIERRLKLWMDGNLNDLVLEGRAIQQRLSNKQPRSNCSDPDGRLAYSFAKLMFNGKTKHALRTGISTCLRLLMLKKIQQYGMCLKIDILLLLHFTLNVWILILIPLWYITQLFLKPWMVL